MSDSITLRGMRFHGHHGVLPDERQHGQTFLIDTAITLPLEAAGTTDALEATVDYRGVYEAARTVIEGESVQLIETLAVRIASATLRFDARIEAVTVTVHKPQVPLPGPLEAAAVTITRRRSS